MFVVIAGVCIISIKASGIICKFAAAARYSYSLLVVSTLRSKASTKGEKRTRWPLIIVHMYQLKRWAGNTRISKQLLRAGQRRK
jgi:hypothetical protein